jgi:protein tyrosine phosphatase
LARLLEEDEGDDSSLKQRIYNYSNECETRLALLEAGILVHCQAVCGKVCTFSAKILQHV